MFFLVPVPEAQQDGINSKINQTSTHFTEVDEIFIRIWTGALLSMRWDKNQYGNIQKRAQFPINLK